MRLKKRIFLPPVKKHQKCTRQPTHLKTHKTMTKEQAKEYIPLLQAYAEGKTIQYLAASGWIDWEYPGFHDAPENYRIKSDPITMTVWISIEGRLITENDMSKNAQDWQNWRKATAVVTFD